MSLTKEETILMIASFNGVNDEKHKEMIRQAYDYGVANAIEEYKLKLLNVKSEMVNNIDKAALWVGFKQQVIEIAEWLKENK